MGKQGEPDEGNVTRRAIQDDSTGLGPTDLTSLAIGRVAFVATE